MGHTCRRVSPQPASTDEHDQFVTWARGEGYSVPLNRNYFAGLWHARRGWLARRAAAEAPALTYEKVRTVLIRHLGWLGAMSWSDDIKAISDELGASTGAAPEAPVQMILHCPKCGKQHVDEPDERTEGWVNPPHRSHLCHGCGHIWRPADVPTEGVKAIQTRGKNDSPEAPDSEQQANRGRIHAKVLAMPDGPNLVGPAVCTVPPPGWFCTRAPGHDGPCAAIPAATTGGAGPTSNWVPRSTEPRPATVTVTDGAGRLILTGALGSSNSTEPVRLFRESATAGEAKRYCRVCGVVAGGYHTAECIYAGAAVTAECLTQPTNPTE